MPVISRKEKTRSGVASQSSGSKSGMASMSATVVVPVRSSICAPSSHERAYSEKSHAVLAAMMSGIQSVKVCGGGNCPAMSV
jgi:hypothetical protein